MTKKVVILGGGMAGLSAAHELSERGFAVSIYERRAVAGGKARSVWVRGTGVGGRPDLPGEHGFRFFPRFYRHLPDTLKRIPYGSNPNGVYDNLVEGHQMVLTVSGQPPIRMPQRFPRSLADLKLLLTGMMSVEADYRAADAEFMVERLWQMATSCEERKLAEYEKIDWWDFVDAASRPPLYQQFAKFIRITVAADPHAADARTEGNMALQMMFAMSEPGISNDRLLNGPTSLVWIDPWVEFLRTQRMVEFHFEAPAEAIRCEQGRIQSVAVREQGELAEVTGDYYLFCMPVEAMARLLAADLIEEGGKTRYRNVLAADPALAGILALKDDVAWMTGSQFYLRRDIRITPGHAMYLDTPWALTSVSQHQFWSQFDLSQYGDGTVHGILSVDISDWQAPGILYHKPARDCTIEEIKNEVWAQLKHSLNVDGADVLRDEDLHSSHVDTDIRYDRVPDPHDTNAEPLLINKRNRWDLRPAGFTRIPNLFLAADYVRTNTELATMEAANEAGRRAVNAILAASSSNAPLCTIWPLHEPWILAPTRWYDSWRYRRGLPWKLSVPWIIQVAQTLLFTAAEIRQAILRRRSAPSKRQA